jgi:hypothetical protein
MGCGADVSREAADVCLIGSDLRRLTWAYDLAHGTTRTIRQNLLWAFVYNGVGVALACTGWLNPMWASGAMVLSSLLVVNNSLRAGTSARRDAPANTVKQAVFDGDPLPMTLEAVPNPTGESLPGSNTALQCELSETSAGGGSCWSTS